MVFYRGESMKEALHPLMETLFTAIRIAGPHLCQSECLVISEIVMPL